LVIWQLATFCAKSMVNLRLLAIARSVAFLAYALAAGLHPIVVLHTVMLPLNFAALLPNAPILSKAVA